MRLDRGANDEEHLAVGQLGQRQVDLFAPLDVEPVALHVSDDADDGLYEKETVRAIVRDYRSWLGGDWRLVWEGEIPGSESLQGQLICENPGWEGGTCLSTEPGDTRIVDTTASFCEDGVLAGDKLAEPRSGAATLRGDGSPSSCCYRITREAPCACSPKALKPANGRRTSPKRVGSKCGTRSKHAGGRGRESA